MENKDLEMILGSIVESAQDEDQELLIETVENIPEELWRDVKSSCKIMETFFEWVNSDFFVYPITFIPEFFWEDRKRVWAYVVTLCEFYEDERIDFNFTELIPEKVLEDKEFAKMLLSCNYFEIMSEIPKSLKSDPEIVFSALECIEKNIEYREDTSMLSAPDKNECVRDLLNEISNELSYDKDFILDFLDYDYFADCVEVVYDWVDKSLWLDKDFVINVLEKDCDAVNYIAEELLNDEDIKKLIE
jgi:hypothetical protein